MGRRVARTWRLIAERDADTRYAVIFAEHDTAARWWLVCVVLMAAAVATAYFQTRTSIGDVVIWSVARWSLAVIAVAGLLVAEWHVAVARALHERCLWRHAPLAPSHPLDEELDVELDVEREVQLAPIAGAGAAADEPLTRRQLRDQRGRA